MEWTIEKTNSAKKYSTLSCEIACFLASSIRTNKPSLIETNNILLTQKTKTMKKTVSGISTIVSTQCINDQQWTKYHSKQGHGFAAEDANAMYGRMRGESVEKVGLDNSLNGADRISNGVLIQTKYCANATKSVNAAFENGSYRYGGMKLEVPKEQYDEAVRIMRGKIANGEVPGVADPNRAGDVVIKGHYTYDEAVKIAKAGNVDSIKFDVQTQSVACLFSLGLSFAVSYSTAKSNGMSHSEALKYAGKQAVKSGAATLVTGVAAQQLLRTQVGRNLAASATTVAKPLVQTAMKTELGKCAITKTASVIAGKQVGGVAAANTVTKALRTNAVVSGAVLAVTIIPDTVKLCSGKISGREFVENTTTNAAGVGGGWAGASAGAAIGSAICPGIGTVVGGIIGGLGGGMGASLGVKRFFGSLK